jgi:hypothetical protein
VKASDFVTARRLLCAKVFAIFALLISRGNGIARAGDPDEDWWSIRCCTITVADRIKLADNYAKSLKQVKGLKADKVSVIHDDRGSTIYYGRYAREYDPGSGNETFKPDPLPDINKIRDLSVTLPDGPAWPFLGATLESLPATNQRYPDWEASKAKGVWSLQVAVFYDTKTMRGRKRAAEDYCKLLRDEGYEAYYHHGTVNSSVIVGAFPRNAIIEVRQANPLTGEATQFTNKIVDPGLLDLQKKFPTNLENGHVMQQVYRSPSGKVTKVPNPSFAVMLPAAAEAAAQKAATPAAPADQPPAKPKRNR